MVRSARARFVLAASTVLLICAGIAALMLLPSYFVLTASEHRANSSAAPLSSAQRASDTAAITHVKSLLKQLSPLVAASTTPTDAIEGALSLRPTGVRIDQVTYTSGAPATLMLVGSADTNGAISKYQTALAADPIFTSVSIPVGALVGTDGGRFSVRLSGAF
jgi:type II secretory pathway pseudopilin PulG